MLKVFKYGLNRNSITTTLKLRAGAKPVSVGCQDNRLVIWIMVNDEITETAQRTFIAPETGEGVEYDQESLKFIGTITDSNGYVYHVFELEQ